MAGLNHYCHSERIEGFLDAVPDLEGEAFLDLKPAGEGLNDPSYLAEPCDLAVRDVGYVTLSEEWHHMVLTSREQLDVLDEDHLLVLFRKQGRLDYLDTIFLVALGEELDSLGHPFRRRGVLIDISFLTI